MHPYNNNPCNYSRSFSQSQRSAFNSTQGYHSAQQRSNRTGFGYAAAPYNPEGASRAPYHGNGYHYGNNNDSDCGSSYWNSSLHHNNNSNTYAHGQPPPPLRSHSTMNQRRLPSRPPPNGLGQNMMMHNNPNIPAYNTNTPMIRPMEPRRPNTVCVKNAPINHTWEQENIVETVQAFTAASIVLWASEMCGEVLTERNIENGCLHFCFDGRTQVGDTTIAVLARDAREGGATLPFKAGTKVEIETSYLAVEMCDPLVHHIVFIKRITLLSEAVPAVEKHLSILSTGESPTDPKLGVLLNGDQVFIPPGLFLKEVLEPAIMSRSPLVQLKEANFDVIDTVLITHRTVVGSVCRAPRWLGDVLGERANVKRIMLTCQPFGDMQQGFASVRKVVPNQCVTLVADEMPDESLFLPTVDLARDLKGRLCVGCRVFFVACRNVPGLTCSWRVMQVQSSVEYGSQIPPVPVLPRTMGRRSNGSPHSLDSSAAGLDGQALHSPPQLIGIDDDVTTVEESRSSTSAILSMSSLSTQSLHLRELTEVFLDFSIKDLRQGWNMPVPSEDPTPSLIDLSIDEGKEWGPCFNPNKLDRPNPFNRHFSSLTTTSNTSLFADEDAGSGIFGSPVYSNSVERCTIPASEGEFRYGDEPHCHLVVDPDLPVQRKKSKKHRARAAAAEAAKVPSALDDLLTLNLDPSPVGSSIDICQAGPSSSLLDLPVEELHQALNKSSTALFPSCTPLSFVSKEAEPTHVSSQLQHSPYVSSVSRQLPSVNENRALDVPPLSATSRSRPTSNVRVIGIYDDISLILEHNLCSIKRVDRKPLGLEMEKKEEKKPVSTKVAGNNKWWFRRRAPRLYPTVIVAEFIEDRDEEEDCSTTIDVTTLTETVVIRNQTASVSNQKENRSTTEQLGGGETVKNTTSEAVASVPTVSRSETVPEQSAKKTEFKSKVAEMILNDSIFGAFFGPLLQQNKKSSS